MNDNLKTNRKINEILRPFIEKAKIDVNTIDDTTDLLSLGVLDSMDVLRVIMEIEQKLDKKIDISSTADDDLDISIQWFADLAKQGT